MPYPILAHFGLGGWDELIYLGIAVIFIGMMGVAWLRARNARYDVETPAVTTRKQVNTESDNDTPDRIQLD